jgi:hypothetical protein
VIAALYVQTNGAYFNLDGIDPWDEVRDARKYEGPYPVVAHPPCQRWGKMWFGQPLTVKRTGIRKIKGDDGGCFQHALRSVRAYGGVLEHPWGSHAWAHFGLNRPPRSGGWIAADHNDGWTCCVEQGQYGHYARKPTMLYAVGTDIPELRWGHTEARYDPAVVERMGLKRAKRLGEVGARGGGTDSTPRIHTPTEFRELLISLARSAHPAKRLNLNQERCINIMSDTVGADAQPATREDDWEYISYVHQDEPATRFWQRSDDELPKWAHDIRFEGPKHWSEE